MMSLPSQKFTLLCYPVVNMSSTLAHVCFLQAMGYSFLTCLLPIGSWRQLCPTGSPQLPSLPVPLRCGAPAEVNLFPEPELLAWPPPSSPSSAQTPAHPPLLGSFSIVCTVVALLTRRLSEALASSSPLGWPFLLPPDLSPPLPTPKVAVASSASFFLSAMSDATCHLMTNLSASSLVIMPSSHSLLNFRLCCLRPVTCAAGSVISLGILRKAIW